MKEPSNICLEVASYACLKCTEVSRSTFSKLRKTQQKNCRKMKAKRERNFYLHQYWLCAKILKTEQYKYAQRLKTSFKRRLNFDSCGEISNRVRETFKADISSLLKLHKCILGLHKIAFFSLYNAFIYFFNWLTLKIGSCWLYKGAIGWATLTFCSNTMKLVAHHHRLTTG